MLAYLNMIFQNFGVGWRHQLNLFNIIFWNYFCRHHYFHLTTDIDLHIHVHLSNINMKRATSGARTAYPSEVLEFTPGFQWVLCYSIFSFLCMFCSSLFALLSFFFWPLLCCLFFFDLQILITPLVSSISSYGPYVFSSIFVYLFTILVIL